jgi:uncharacterized protein (DUF983 family)
LPLARPVPQCPACGQDWRGHRADDFPPYLAILVTGHVMAPVLIALGLKRAVVAGDDGACAWP